VLDRVVWAVPRSRAACATTPPDCAMAFYSLSRRTVPSVSTSATCGTKPRALGSFRIQAAVCGDVRSGRRSQDHRLRWRRCCPSSSGGSHALVMCAGPDSERRGLSPSRPVQPLRRGVCIEGASGKNGWPSLSVSKSRRSLCRRRIVNADDEGSSRPRAGRANSMTISFEAVAVRRARPLLKAFGHEPNDLCPLPSRVQPDARQWTDLR